MAQFPSSIPTTHTFSSSQYLSNMGTVGHIALHQGLEGEVVALATKVGINSSVDTNSHDYKITSLQTRMTTAETDISAIETDLSNVKSGAEPLSAPTISSFVNSQHDHTNAGEGGQLDTGSLVANAITKATQVINAVGPAITQNINNAAGFTDLTNASGNFESFDGGDLFITVNASGFKTTNQGRINLRLLIDSTQVPNSTGWCFFFNTLSQHNAFGWSAVVTGIPAGTYTVKLQASTASDNVNFNDDDQYSVSIIELKR